MAWSRVVASIVVLGAGLSAPAQVGALAFQDAPDTALIDSIVRDLKSDDVATRVDAQQRLSDAGAIKLKDIEAAFRRARPTPEQCKRLLSAAGTKFRAEPRAGMGVISDINPSERGVLLVSIVPEFPAAEVLRSGDRLLSVDGQAINDLTMMRPVVVAHDPGDEVSAVVLRGGVTMNLRVKLGRYADLNSRDRFMQTSELLDEAWAIRCAKLLASLPPAEAPIESGLPDEARRLDPADEFGIGVSDGGDPNLDTMVRPDTRRLQNPDSPETVAAAGGEPRGDASQIRWATIGSVGPGVRMAPGDGQRIDRRADALAEAARLRAAMVADLREQQTRHRAKINDLTGQLRNADAAQRELLTEQIASLRRRIESLDRQAQSLLLVP